MLSQQKLAYPVLMPRPNVPVDWVSSTELADPWEYLEPRTLVLTNGVFADQDYDWTSFVSQVAAAGVAGLGIGLAITFDSIPGGLIKACESAQMNLLCLEGHVPFVAVSRVAVHYLQQKDSQPEPVPAGLMMQQQLSRAAVSGSRLAILRTLASILEATVAVHGTSGTAVVGPTGVDVQGYLDGQIGSAVAELGRHGSRGSMNIVDANRRLSVLPLGLSGKPREFLGVMAERPLDEWERSSLSLAMSLLSLEAESRRTQATNVHLAHRTVLRLLTEGHTEAARTAAEEFDLWFPRATVQALLVRGSVRLDQIPRPCLRARWGNDVLVVTGETLVEPLLAGLPEGLQVGVGDAHEIEDVAASVAQARHANRMASNIDPVVTWRQARVDSIVGCLNEELANQFVDHQLGGISKDANMMETLEAYLASNGSIAAASTLLRIHRNTLNYRLRQIRERVGDLEDPSVRANLWIALQVQKDDKGAPRPLP